MDIEVIKSTKSSKDGFVTTVQASKSTVCPITGQPMVVKRKFLTKTPVEAKAGTKVALDIAGYNIKEYQSQVVAEGGEVKTINNSWLHMKVEA